MKRHVRAAFCIFLFIVFLDLCWIAPAPAGDAKKAHTMTKGLIETQVPVKRDFTLTCPWFGRVESRETNRVKALTDGEILAIKAPDETPVTRGTLLFTLGGPRVEGRLKSLNAEIAALRPRVLIARQNVRLKKEAVAQKIAKKETLLSAEQALFTLQSSLERMKLQLAVFRNSLKIRARMDGLFTGRQVSKGQAVHTGDVLCEIVPLKSLRIVATLFPPRGIRLKGCKVLIHTAAGRDIAASVATVLPRHTRKGAAIIWIEGKTVNHQFSPGETISGVLVTGVQKGLMAIPVSAIIRDQDERPFIFVKGPKGYIKRPVKTGPISGEWVGILSGLQEKDQVVIHGGYELFYRHFNKIYKVAD